MAGRRTESCLRYARTSVIKYIGSKRLLVPGIVGVARAIGDVGRVLDLFSGTSRVGHALKAAGFQVTANDHNTYAYRLAQCYVAANRDKLEGEVAALIDELNRIPGRPGYF